MKLIFASKASKDDGNQLPTRETLTNFYPIPAPEGSKGGMMIRSVPGVTDHASLTGPFLRRLATVADRLYALADGKLHWIRSGGSSVVLGDIPDDPNATIVGHRDALTIVAAGEYFVYEDREPTVVTGAGRITPGSVAFLDQYTMLGDANGREIEWTEIGDPTTRNALHFATTEADDDKVVRVLRLGAYLAVMKRESLEVWANTGQGGFNAFARVPGSVHDRGLLSFNLATATGTDTSRGLFFVSNDKVAYYWEGDVPQAVSTAGVNDALKVGDPTHCFYYEWRGHAFCVIRFSDRPAWVWDMTTGLWHRRALGPEHQEWDVVCSAYCYGQWFLGSRQGRVYTLQERPEDAGQVMRRTAVSRPLYMDGRRFCVPFLEFLGDFGKAELYETAPNWIVDEWGDPITDEFGEPLLHAEQENTSQRLRPARMWIRLSRDNRSFGVPKHKDIGKVGVYNDTCRFRKLGQARNLTVEMNITDPVDVPFMAEANIEVT